MGRVFTCDEVLHGRFPTPYPDAFRLATAYVRHCLETCATVRGALFFGSLLRDDFTIRSDVDCLVLVDDSHQHNSADTLSVAVAHAAATWNVEISFEVLSVTAAEKGRHRLTPMFIEYLQKIAKEGAIKGIPLPSIPQQVLSPHAELRNYLIHQESRLRKGFLFFPNYSVQQQCHFLRKVLESGYHIARKYLNLRGRDRFKSQEDLINRYRIIVGGTAYEVLQQLAETDSVYTCEVVWQQEHGPDIERYQRALDVIRAATPLALEFVALNWEFVQ